MLHWIWKHSLAFLQRQCDHNPKHVAADILEGDHEGEDLQWCRQCGAYRRHVTHAWTEPRPEWY